MSGTVFRHHSDPQVDVSGLISKQQAVCHHKDLVVHDFIKDGLPAEMLPEIFPVIGIDHMFVDRQGICEEVFSLRGGAKAFGSLRGMVFVVAAGLGIHSIEEVIIPNQRIEPGIGEPLFSDPLQRLLMLHLHIHVVDPDDDAVPLCPDANRLQLDVDRLTFRDTPIGERKGTMLRNGLCHILSGK